MTFILSLSVFLSATAQGFMENYTPFGLIEKVASSRTPQKYLGDCRVGFAPVTSKGITLQALNDGTQLEFSGLDKAKTVWKFTTDGANLGCNLYEVELDSKPTWMVVKVTGAVGTAPGTALTFLQIDAAGKPLHAEITGYFSNDEKNHKGIADLVPIDGIPHLIYMRYENGYWYTALLRWSQGQWTHVKGEKLGIKFPAFTRFTERPNHKLVQPPPNKIPEIPFPAFNGG